MTTLTIINSAIAMNIAASVQKHSLEYIRQKYGWLPQASMQINRLGDKSILELRGESLTLSCLFGENDDSCRGSYLFPDTEKDLTDCIDVCNKQYHSIAANLWANHSNNTFIRLLNDSKIGNILVFETIG